MAGKEKRKEKQLLLPLSPFLSPIPPPSLPPLNKEMRRSSRGSISAAEVGKLGPLNI